MVSPLESVTVSAADDAVTITIFHTNDIHGRQMEGIGLAKVATLRKTTENSLLLDAGDATQGTILTTISSGEYALDLMNLAGYDAMCAGNHEFDYSQEQILKNSSITNFPILSANVLNSDNEPFFKGTFNNGSNENNGCNTIFDVDGVQVGVFGLTTVETETDVNPNNTKGLTFRDELQVAKEQIKELDSEGADVIICLAHVGNSGETLLTSEDIANGLDDYAKDLDLIIDAHSHTIEDSVINGVQIVQTGCYLENLGEVVMKYENDNVTIESTELLNSEDLEDVKEDEQVLECYENISSTIDAETNAKIASTKHALWGTIATYPGGRQECRFTETNLGDFITDIYRESGEELQENGALSGEYKDLPVVAVENGGGIRSSMQGDINYKSILEVMPFSNTLSYKCISPKVLYEMMELSLESVDYQDPETGHIYAKDADDTLIDAKNGGFLQISGFNVVFEPGKEDGDKIVSLTIDGESEPLDRNDETKSIILAANTFLNAGGNNYTMLTDDKIPLIIESDVTDKVFAEGLRRYSENGTKELNIPITDNRIIMKSDYVAKDYDVHICVNDENNDPLANTEISYYVDDGEAQNAITDANGQLNITVSDGPHTIGLTNNYSEVYVCNYTGTGVTKAENESFPILTMKDDSTENPEATSGPAVTNDPDATEDPSSTSDPSATSDPSSTSDSSSTGDPIASANPSTQATSTASGSTIKASTTSAVASNTSVESTNKIKPSKTKIKKLKGKKKAIFVKWKKVTKNATGYKVACSTSKKFKKKKTTVKNIKSVKKTKITIKKLKSKKKYYVRVRVKGEGGVSSTWSKVKSVKTK
ncbi:MAG: 5'-nucleotidase C-terminal domain-containing protein [Lachnospiraceae bacterium]|nr:5'-nucleotidase C-terminal domain-containing protein [Lachnospiraceae bacterium]